MLRFRYFRCVARPPPDDCGDSPPTFPPSAEPIRVATRSRGRKRPNVFYDDRGFPDQSHDFDVILHSIHGGSVLRKRKHPAPALDDVDPAFLSIYDEAKHGSKLRSELDLSHLDKPTQVIVYRLIQKYWSVFDDKGQFLPVRDYTCSIDTGSARPIAVKKIHHGPREIPIMRRCIASLEKMGHIRQIHDGEWLFKALLAPKPHQEHIHNIDDFVWRTSRSTPSRNRSHTQFLAATPPSTSRSEADYGCGCLTPPWDIIKSASQPILK